MTRRWIWARDKLQEKLPRVTWRLVYVVVKLVLRIRAGKLYDHELITCKLVTFVHCIPFWAILKKIAHSRTEDWTGYLCMFVDVCMYGLCHTNQIEATILPCKVIHQWDGPFKQYIPEGQPRRHWLRPSWKRCCTVAENIGTISQHCPTEVIFSLCALLMCLFSQRVQS